ncbi:preprotein translocase subunit SecA [Nitrospina sp. 32_T5]|uniref:preprotein translocase subunit SecA n=1 Tax=unclassified Nitrospina TaxID=2638683 RepID=UPI003F9E2673
MFIGNWARPGVASGLYPEKQKEQPGWLDTAWRRLTQLRGPEAIAPPPEAHNFLVQVNRLANEFRELSDKEIRNEALAIRSSLHRQGFQPYFVARSFALVTEWFVRNENVRPGSGEILAGWGILHQRAVESCETDDNAVSVALSSLTAALAGFPVHVITATDHLVRRLSSRLSRICKELGVSTGEVVAGMDIPSRQEQYRADIAFTTHKQVAFDYLRDHLASEGRRGRLQLHLDRLSEKEGRGQTLVLRGLCFAIIDELDTVLIDDARAPLLISRNTDLPGVGKVYEKALELSALLHIGMDFDIDEVQPRVHLNANGRIRIAQVTEHLGGMWSGIERSQDLITQALTATHLLIRDRHYRVDNEKIHMEERVLRALRMETSWQRGLLQLLELKEGLPSTGDRETLAKISYQELFQRYLHLGGVSHTLMESRRELESLYPFKVMRVPMGNGFKRKAASFHFYPDAERKWEAVAERAEALHRSGKSVFIAVRSLPMGELLASILAKRGLSCHVLTDNHNENEAFRLNEKARPGSITILLYSVAKGMGGTAFGQQGTFAGPHGILAECSESRRHDRQLIQRCGAGNEQGGPDYFISLEDDLVQVFAPKWVVHVARRLGFLGNWIARSLWILTQWGVGRHHAAARAKLKDMDKQTSKMLAFSGRSE